MRAAFFLFRDRNYLRKICRNYLVAKRYFGNKRTVLAVPVDTKGAFHIGSVASRAKRTHSADQRFLFIEKIVDKVESPVLEIAGVQPADLCLRFILVAFEHIVEQAGKVIGRCEELAVHGVEPAVENSRTGINGTSDDRGAEQHAE